MPKLCEVVAVSKDRKKVSSDALTEAYHLAKKRELFEGRLRTYEPLDDAGDKLPDEGQSVQCTISSLQDRVFGPVKNWLDVCRTQDEGNTLARADVEVDGVALLKDVPVQHLLYLEKFLKDMQTFVEELPVLDASVEWIRDENAGAYRSKSPVQKMKTAKMPRVIEKSPATDKFPAQTEVYHIDVNVGTWTDQRFSGAIPFVEKRSLVERVRNLRDGVKAARERANQTLVVNTLEGETILNYLFGD